MLLYCIVILILLHRSGDLKKILTYLETIDTFKPIIKKMKENDFLKSLKIF